MYINESIIALRNTNVNKTSTNLYHVSQRIYTLKIDLQNQSKYCIYLILIISIKVNIRNFLTTLIISKQSSTTFT